MHQQKAQQGVLSIHSRKHGIPTHVGKPIEATKCIARILSGLGDFTPRLKKSPAVQEKVLLSHISTKYGKDYRAPPASRKKWDDSIHALQVGALILTSKETVEDKEVVSFTLTKLGMQKLEELMILSPELFETSTSPNTQQAA